MNVRTICLAILSGGDATGYEIRKQSTEGHFSFFVDASYGAIYPALARLEEEGLVTCSAEAQAGKPSRKVYSITEAGRLAFIEALSVLPEPDTFRSQFLLIAKYAELLEPEQVRMAIDRRIAALREKLDLIENLCCEFASPGAKWTANYGVTLHKASIAYLEEHRDELEKIAGTKKLPEPVAAT